MKLAITIGTLLTTLAATAAPANAAGLSCHPAAGGGVKAPALTASGIAGSGSGGYACAFRWAEQTIPEYESGGLWHAIAFADATRVNPRYASQTWTPGGFSYPNACRYNWRFHVYFSWRGRVLAGQTGSRELRRSC